MSKFLFGALAAALLAVVAAADASAQATPQSIRVPTDNAGVQGVLTVDGTRVTARFEPTINGFKVMTVTNRATGLSQDYEALATSGSNLEPSATLAEGRYNITLTVRAARPGGRIFLLTASWTDVRVGGAQ
jgi:hypothetical protein